MNKETYIKMTATFRENAVAAKKLEIINKIATYTVFIAYPIFVLYLFFTASPSLARAVIAPLDGFIVVSVFRYLVNRPRPYEKFDLPPVIPKNTHGKSFPSRHVFSAFIIAFTMLMCTQAASLFWCIGIVLVLLAVVIAVVRVISGVHYISDVIGALFFAVIEIYICSFFVR